MWTAFIFFGLALSSSNSFACSEVRLDKDPNVLGRVPAWDQGKNGTCWAFAAAQLIDAYRFSNGDKDFDHLTSPLMLAADGVVTGGASYEWGTIEAAINGVREKGSCNAKWVSDHLGTKKASEVIQNLEGIHDLTKSVQTWAGHMTEISKVPRRFSFKSKAKSVLDLPELYVSSEKVRESRIQAAEVCSTYLSQIGIEDKIAPGFGAIVAALESDRSSFAREILSFVCKDMKRMDHLPDLQKTYLKPTDSLSPPAQIKELQPVLDQLLESKKPVAVNFCSESVMRPGAHLYATEGRLRCFDNTDHYAVIVGSQKNKSGQCEYLVRDSYCSEYERKAQGKNEIGSEASRTTQGKTEAAKSQNVCQNGQHWMTAEQLLTNTKNLSYF